MSRQGALSKLRPKKSLTKLQERFVNSGFAEFTDQESIELVFSLSLPIGESKRLAKACLKRFGSLGGLLSAPVEELQQVGLSPTVVLSVKVLHDLPIQILKKKVTELPVYDSSKQVFDYLSYSMRDLEKEIFKVMYLNNRNQITDVDDLFEGTADSIPIHSREIIDGALKYKASAVIFVHNHPSGDCTPSKTDKQFTRDLVYVGNILQIRVLDHIVIGGDSYFSFADEGLIQKYQDNFLNLRIRAIFDDRAARHLPFLSCDRHAGRNS